MASIGLWPARPRRMTLILCRSSAGMSSSSRRVPRLEDIDRRVDALVADLAVEHELHVSGAFELLEDELVHAAAGIDERGGDDGQRARFLGVARRGEKLARDFQRARIDAAGHGASAAAHGVVEGAADAGDRVEQDEDILARIRRDAWRARWRAARCACATSRRMSFELAMISARRDGALDFGDFLGPLIDEQDDELDLGMILHHGLGDVLEQRGLAGARRRDDEAALAFADRASSDR